MNDIDRRENPDSEKAFREEEPTPPSEKAEASENEDEIIDLTELAATPEIDQSEGEIPDDNDFIEKILENTLELDEVIASEMDTGSDETNDFRDDIGLSLDESEEEAESESDIEETDSVLQPPTVSMSDEQIESALERVVEKIYSEKIESMLLETVERTIRQEIEKLKNLIEDAADDDM